MAYQKQNFTDGDVLYGRQLNHIEDGVVENETNIGQLKEEKADKTDLDTERKRIDVLNEGGLNLKDEVIDTSIKAWLADHPEATTTVQDESLTYKKLVKGTLGYVTPEMYGAKGDGETDDTDAIKAALAINAPVFFQNSYVVSENLTLSNGIIFGGNGSTLLFKDCSDRIYITVDCDSAAIYNLTIRNFYTESDSIERFAIQVSRASEKLIIQNVNIFLSNKNKPNISACFIAAVKGDIKSVIIDKCTFDIETQASVGGCIWVWGAKYDIYDVTVTNTTLRNCGKDETFAAYTNTGTVKNVIAENCTIVNKNDTQISDNVVSNVSDGITLAMRGCKFEINGKFTVIIKTRNDSKTIIDSCVFDINSQGTDYNNFTSCNNTIISNCSIKYKAENNLIRIGNTTFENCEFIADSCRIGLIDEVTFKNCNFKITHISIGEKAELTMHGCEMNSTLPWTIQSINTKLVIINNIFISDFKIYFKTSGALLKFINNIVSGDLNITVGDKDTVMSFLEILNNKFAKIEILTTSGVQILSENAQKFFLRNVVKNNWDDNATEFKF